ncbi:MAG: hypothetical protein QG641_1507 [Candidatus Poribacteria bacterium]|nr:hypothetical protein [Candidatus Poribacteria bacterium]
MAMQQDITIYFEQAVIPLIDKKHPEVASEMIIQITGSFGLGIADEFSDLDANIWLDDPLWKRYGGHLQLTLENYLEQFAPNRNHAEICVWPLSWLGDRKDFLENKADLPWEKVSLEALFEIQENLILYDPNRIFHKLKEATVPDRFPEWLWKKLLIGNLSRLRDDFDECQSAVKREQMIEAHIILGCVLEDLLHIGFIINRKYYPWRKHLRWAFEKLYMVASKVLHNMDIIISSSSWGTKFASIEVVGDIYKNYIRENNILSSEIIENLLWAERCAAWSNPNWRDRITKCEQKAKEAGYDPGDAWVWSLWDWIQE